MLGINFSVDHEFRHRTAAEYFDFRFAVFGGHDGFRRIVGNAVADGRRIDRRFCLDCHLRGRTFFLLRTIRRSGHGSNAVLLGFRKVVVRFLPFLFVPFHNFPFGRKNSPFYFAPIRKARLPRLRSLLYILYHKIFKYQAK